MVLGLELRARRPRWWEKKWKPKKPILYLLEYDSNGNWINTYWWGGNWKFDGKVKFYSSGEVRTGTFLDRLNSKILVVGRSGTSLFVMGNPLGDQVIKSLNPNDSEWTCFGRINGIGTFAKEVSRFNLIEKIKESYR